MTSFAQDQAGCHACGRSIVDLLILSIRVDIDLHSNPSGHAKRIEYFNDRYTMHNMSEHGAYIDMERRKSL